MDNLEGLSNKFVLDPRVHQKPTLSFKGVVLHNIFPQLATVIFVDLPKGKLGKSIYCICSLL